MTSFYPTQLPPPSTHSQVIQFNPLIISPLPWHIKKYKVNKLLIYFR